MGFNCFYVKYLFLDLNDTGLYNSKEIFSKNLKGVIFMIGNKRVWFFEEEPQKNNSLIRRKQILEKINLKHVHYLINYELSSAAFLNPQSTNFMKNLDKWNDSLKLLQNGEENLLSLLDLVKEKGAQGNRLNPEETQNGIKKIFQYFRDNTPVTSAPQDEEERKAFYDKLQKGYGLISHVISQEYLEKGLDENQVYSCLEMIGEGAHYCAGRWRKVLDELFVGLSGKIKGIEVEPEMEKDRVITSIKGVFYNARSAVSIQLSNDFVNKHYGNSSEGNRLHYTTFFQRVLNQDYGLNLPITEEKDPFIENEFEYLLEISNSYLKKHNVDGMIIEKAIESLRDKIKSDRDFYEHVVDFGKSLYHKNQINLLKEDVVEFLSEDFFEGFSREIKIGSLIYLLQEKKFINQGESLAFDKRKGVNYFKKLLLNKNWKAVEECLKEGADCFKPNPIPNLSIPMEDGRTSLLTCLIGTQQYELAQKIIQQGADVEHEDYSAYAFMNRSPFSPAHGRRPLHMAVLTGNKNGVDLLVENGADPFGGKLFIMGEAYNPFELALKEKKQELVNYFVDWVLKKDVNRKVKISYGEVPIINYLISMKQTDLAIKLVEAGVDLEAEEYSRFYIRTALSPYKNSASGRKALHIAIETSAPDELIQLMLNRGANPFEGKLQIKKGNEEAFLSPLDYAVYLGRWSYVKSFVEHKTKDCIHHEVKTLKGPQSLISILIERGEIDLVKKMVLEGANPNSKIQGQVITALHLAVHYGNYDLVECMIKVGANPFQERILLGERSYTPFEMALKNKDYKMVDLIFKLAKEKEMSFTCLKDFNLQFEEGTTSALSYLIARGYKEAAKALVLNGANVNQGDISSETFWRSDFAVPLQGRTPLHIAVKVRDKEMVKFLLEKGANVNLVMDIGTNMGLTPSNLAEREGSLDIAVMIQMHQVRGKEHKERVQDGITFNF
jgi:ankyrin repeat protein